MQDRLIKHVTFGVLEDFVSLQKSFDNDHTCCCLYVSCLYASLAFAHGQTIHCIPRKCTHDNLSGGI